MRYQTVLDAPVRLSAGRLCALATLTHVSKHYNTSNGRVNALADVNLEIRQGEFVSIMGPSGSGKSTLLHILGLLSRPSAGICRFDDVDISRMADRALSQLRSRRIGFVFQAFHLLGGLTALENVELPLIYQRIGRRDRLGMAAAALKSVGMEHRMTHYPRQLSGGECQRTAIARAIVSRPSAILADEPTGNLDTRTGLDILDILESLHAGGTALVIVTHEQAIAARAGRRIFLRDGSITGFG